MEIPLGVKGNYSSLSRRQGAGAAEKHSQQSSLAHKLHLPGEEQQAYRHTRLAHSGLMARTGLTAGPSAGTFLSFTHPSSTHTLEEIIENYQFLVLIAILAGEHVNS